MSDDDPKDSGERGQSPTCQAALLQLMRGIADLVASCDAWMDRLNDDARARGMMTESDSFWSCQLCRVKQVFLTIEGFLDWVQRDEHRTARVTDGSVAQSIYDDLRTLADRLESENRRSQGCGQDQQSSVGSAVLLGPAPQWVQSTVEVAMGLLRLSRPGVTHRGDPDDEWLVWY